MATHRAASARRAVLRDRLVEQLLLVRRGTPAAVDVELDPVAPGIRRGLAERTEERRVEVGHGRILVVEDRHAVRDLAVGDAQRADRPELAGVDGTSPRSRSCEACADGAATLGGAADDEPASERQPRTPTSAATTTSDGEDGRSSTAPCCRCWLDGGTCLPVKAARCCQHVCGFRYADDMRPLSSIESCACWSSRTSPSWRRPSATACGWRRSRPTSPATATPLWSC